MTRLRAQVCRPQVAACCRATRASGIVVRSNGIGRKRNSARTTTTASHTARAWGGDAADLTLRRHHRPGCAGAAGIAGARARLSHAHRHHRGAVGAGRHVQHPCPADRRQARAALRKIVRGREPPRRQLGDGRRRGDARAARRLHAHGRDQLDAGDQRHPAQEPALRSAHRFRSDHAHRAFSRGLAGQRVASGPLDRGPGQACAHDTGRPLLRLGRPRHRAASQWRIAQGRARRRDAPYSRTRASSPRSTILPADTSP